MEITGNETFQIDSFLEDNKQFLIKTNELIRHYDKKIRRPLFSLISKIYPEKYLIFLDGKKFPALNEQTSQ